MTLSRRAFLAATPLAGCGGGAGIEVAQSLSAPDDLAPLIAASSGVVTLEPGRVYRTHADVTGKQVTIIAHGAVIDGSITKRDHGNKLTVLGGRFIGGINLDMAPSQTTSDDYLFDGCDFEAGVRLIGAREGRINACTFRGTGLYLRATVSAFVHQGIFIGQGRGTGVFYDGTGSPYDAGLVLSDCEVMGWDRGVDVRLTDWLRMSGCTVDYNESCNTSLVGQDGADISGCYLGSKNATPALHITGGTEYSSKITVRSEITGHAETADYDSVVVDGAPDNIVIAGSHINFYTRYGIRYVLNHGRMTVTGTSFAPRGGFGQFPIFNGGNAADSNLLIADNTFPPDSQFAGSGIVFAKWRDNRT